MTICVCVNLYNVGCPKTHDRICVYMDECEYTRPDLYRLYIWTGIDLNRHGIFFATFSQTKYYPINILRPVCSINLCTVASQRAIISYHIQLISSLVMRVEHLP